MASALLRLDPAPDDKQQARDALLRRLANDPNGLQAEELVSGITRLAATAEDKRQVRETFLGLLTARADDWGAARLARGVAALDPTAPEKQQARKVLLKLLTGDHDSDEVFDPADSDTAEDLIQSVTALDPTVRDLSTWHAWTAQPTAELFATVRRNSPLSDWLAALPSLPD